MFYPAFREDLEQTTCGLFQSHQWLMASFWMQWKIYAVYITQNSFQTQALHYIAGLKNTDKDRINSKEIYLKWIGIFSKASWSLLILTDTL